MNAPDEPREEPQEPLEALVDEFFRRRAESPDLTVAAFLREAGERAAELLRRLQQDPRWSATVGDETLPTGLNAPTAGGQIGRQPPPPPPFGVQLGEALRKHREGASPPPPAANGETTGGQELELTHTVASQASSHQLDNVSKLLKPRPFGNYRLLEVLGRGGMGIVFKAEQVGLNRTVAIKMIRAGELASEEDVARFYTEARAAAKIEHPHVVNIYEVGEIDGHHYFSMDYLDGVDLSQLLKQGPLPPRRAAHIALQMARAIMAAHEQGFLHRDLKPANLVIDADDHVTVTDFGLAKQIGVEGQGYTQTGAALGTPSYMAPEQAAGRLEELGPACDVYSMGAVLYAMLTATPPFRSETLVKTIMAVIDEEPPPPKERNREVDPDLATICMKCLHKDPARRFQSAAEFAEELERYLSGEPILSRPASRLRRAWAWSRRIPLVAALMGRRVTEATPAHRWAQRAIILAMLAGAFALMFAAPAARSLRQSRMPRRVVVAGGQPDGAYHAIAEQLSAYLQQRTECEQALPLATAGSQENADALLAGRVQLALMQESALARGPLAVVTPVYYEPVHIVVRTSTGVTDLRRLQGRPVSIGLKGSGMNASAAIVLRNLGLDVERRYQHFTDLSEDAALDAALVTTGASNPVLRELLGSREFRLLPMPQIEEVVRHPSFKLYRLRPHHYPEAGLPEDGVLTVATPAFLAALPTAPAPLVRRSLEWVFNSEHPEFMSREEAAQWRFMPLHDEAKQFFGEVAGPEEPGWPNP